MVIRFAMSADMCEEGDQIDEHDPPAHAIGSGVDGNHYIHQQLYLFPLPLASVFSYSCFEG